MDIIVSLQQILLSNMMLFAESEYGLLSELSYDHQHPSKQDRKLWYILLQ